MLSLFKRERICSALPEADSSLGVEVVCNLGRLDFLAFAERMYKSLLLFLTGVWCMSMMYLLFAGSLIDAGVLTCFIGMCVMLTWAKKFAIGRWYDLRFDQLLTEWRKNPNMLRVLEVFAQQDATAHMLLSACIEAENST